MQMRHFLMPGAHSLHLRGLCVGRITPKTLLKDLIRETNMATKKADLFGAGATGRPSFSDGGRSGDGYFCNTSGDYREAEAARQRGRAHMKAALGYALRPGNSDTAAQNIAQKGTSRQKQTWADEGQYRNEAFNNFGWPGNGEPVTKAHQGRMPNKRGPRG